MSIVYGGKDMVTFVSNVIKAKSLDALVHLLPKKDDSKFVCIIKLNILSHKIEKCITFDLASMRPFTAQCKWPSVNAQLLRTYVQKYGVQDFTTMCELLIVLLQDIGLDRQITFLPDLYMEIISSNTSFSKSHRELSDRDVLHLMYLITEYQRNCVREKYPTLDLIMYMLIDLSTKCLGREGGVQSVLKKIRSVYFTIDAMMVILDTQKASLQDIIEMLRDPIFRMHKDMWRNSLFGFSICMSPNGEMTIAFDDARACCDDHFIRQIYDRLWQEVLALIAVPESLVTHDQLVALAESLSDMKVSSNTLSQREDAIIMALMHIYKKEGATTLKDDVVFFSTTTGKHRFIAAFLQERTAITHEQMLILSHAIRSCDHGGGTLLEKLQHIPFSDDVNGR